MDLDISPARPDEVAFIASSWKLCAKEYELKAQRKTRTSREFFHEYNESVARALAERPTLLVARPPDNPGFIYGWLCALETPESWALLYVYTRPKYRLRGVMWQLMREALQHDPGLPPVFCARSWSDNTFERRGFEFSELRDVLEQVRAA